MSGMFSEKTRKSAIGGSDNFGGTGLSREGTRRKSHAWVLGFMAGKTQINVLRTLVQALLSMIRGGRRMLRQEEIDQSVSGGSYETSTQYTNYSQGVHSANAETR